MTFRVPLHQHSAYMTIYIAACTTSCIHIFTYIRTRTYTYYMLSGLQRVIYLILYSCLTHIIATCIVISISIYSGLQTIAACIALQIVA